MNALTHITEYLNTDIYKQYKDRKQNIDQTKQHQQKNNTQQKTTTSWV